MLSIPRDLWVNIPGFGYSRLNTAWTLGRGSKLPGGGSAFAMKTISHFVGVPIDYYVQVDFDTFIDVIDLPYAELVEAARETHRQIYWLKNGLVKPYAEKPRYN